MKIRKLLFVILLSAIFSAVNAQQKTGYPNSQTTPRHTLMLRDTDSIKSNAYKELEKMYALYTQKLNALQTESPNRQTPDSVLLQKMYELQNLQLKIETLEKTMDDTLLKVNTGQLH